MQYKINKYANAMAPEIPCRGNMQTKVICNAMINCKRYSCSVLGCEMCERIDHTLGLSIACLFIQELQS
jgi:hypothetical protein